MSTAVLTLFSLTNVSQIMAIMMDNTSNNDTMMEAIESQCHEAGIEFSAKKSRMHCMPHTIHLVAIKVNREFLWFKHWH